MKLNYRNFYWTVTWIITYVCNLKCKYCLVTPTNKHPDIERALNKILEIKPKDLCLSGGEPLLVPDFTNIMRKLRTGLPDSHIVLNTNATLPDRLCEVLPYINALAFSIDGVGETNKELRGIDGDILLETLERMIRVQIEMNNSFKIDVVPVVTVDNFRSMDPLFEMVDGLFKRYGNWMYIDVKPMHPYDQPMTVAYDRRIYREFLELSAEWPSRYEIPIWLRGVGDLDPLGESGAKTCISCRRQYFAGIVTGDGDFLACKPEKYYDYYHEMFFQRGWRDKAQAAWGAINELLVHPYNPTCHFPCEHGEFLNEPLAMHRASEVLEWARKNHIVLSKEEADEAFGFIKKRFDKDFIIDTP